MIPRHSLPFDIYKLFSVMVKGAPAADPSDVEKTFADALGVQSVIMLPSVRAGIYLAILSADEQVTKVVGPAYTCGTVHEAMSRSGVDMQLVDTARGTFLMSSDDVRRYAEPGCALVLSEVYGIPYGSWVDMAADGQGPAVRILDMAMAVPSPHRTRSLRGNEVALFSFGWGKPMYAGWGGIACFQDPGLAGKVREVLSRSMTGESAAFKVQRAGVTFMMTAMNQRVLYGLSHGRRIYRLVQKADSLRGDRACLPHASEGGFSPQWRRPMTDLSRKLALHNMRHSAENADIRRDQAEIYRKSLSESGLLTGPGGDALPQSHFPIRVASSIRDDIRDYLRGRGIDTGTLFQLSPWVNRECCPNAAEAADEVVTLPLGPTITPAEVKMISECVKDAVKELANKTLHTRTTLNH